MNQRKLNSLKAWYAFFVAIMDADDMNSYDKFERLQVLRKRIKQEAPELENAGTEA